MPNYPNHPKTELQNAIRSRNAMLVVGTGVSIAASTDPIKKKPHPQASWVGLLESGLAWIEKHNLISKSKVNAHRTLLHDDPDTYSFINAAEQITRQMGGSSSMHFESWLKNTIGKIEVNDLKVINALHELRKQGCLLATTNYDGLLLNDGLSPVSWHQHDTFLRVVRNRELDKVLFIHGYWRTPSSVILDWSSYERITRDEQYRDDLLSTWKAMTWIYIGCGVNGLNDPDFGLLLNRYGKRARQAGLWDFCLVRNDQREEFQAYFDNLEINVLAMPFGQSYDDLPEYLINLSPSKIETSYPNVVPAPKDGIPAPPDFYAQPRYIGSHIFVGRTRELEELSDWAKAADPANMLLYEAIGGNGKSFLTWEWITKSALKVRNDWAGCFWYSFYERGAIMADFCQQAIAYMTGTPLKELRKKKTSELKDTLLTNLHSKPWLVVLDGLERVLIAYHRIDAAEMEDETTNKLIDKIAKRNPRNAIREEDNDLLRSLAAAKPSKILVSSRLTPRKLLNEAGQPIPGVRRITLPGLRPSDAELLLRSCNITGDSDSIQQYLTENCDNHPLVIGILAGLVNNYLPARGNFDKWAADPKAGAALNLAELDLVQRRNHILKSAFDSLPPMSRQLLATLAFVSESVDYETLKALNPYLPPEPKEVENPESPEDDWNWKVLTSDEQETRLTKYKEKLNQWHEFEKKAKKRLSFMQSQEVINKLGKTVNDLEQRGLVQYDGQSQRYDLHPVVRGVALGGIKPEERNNFGSLVIDHFSSIPHNPYNEAVKLEDLHPGLHIVRTLLKLGRFQQAADEFVAILCNPLLFKLNAYPELLSIERPFFKKGWDVIPDCVDKYKALHLANDAGIALQGIGKNDEAFKVYNSIINYHTTEKDWDEIPRVLGGGFSSTIIDQNLLSKAYDIALISQKLASVTHNEYDLGYIKGNYFSLLILLGRYKEAKLLWNEMKDKEFFDLEQRLQVSIHSSHIEMQLHKGNLNETELTKIEGLAREGHFRSIVQYLYGIRGHWYTSQNHWDLAAECFSEALRMARETGQPTHTLETYLLNARVQSDDEVNYRAEAERLSAAADPNHLALAKLWYSLHDLKKAKHHAIAAYEWAWADGEPFVRRHSLNMATDLLKRMDLSVPVLPSYDTSKKITFSWEHEILNAIENEIH